MTAPVEGGSARPPGRRAAWQLAALALAALLVDLGSFHRLEHADSLVPVLVSLQRWTPFYWDQERYGMLVPLLALPLRDPLASLLLQRGLLVLSGLAAVVLLARHVMAGRDWPLAGALAAGTLLLLPSPAWAFEYLGDQPYGLALALALAGLAVAEPGPEGRRPAPRLAAGLLLVLLAHWVNAAAGVLPGALALARAAEDLLEGEAPAVVGGRLGVDARLLAAGLALGQASIWLYPALSGNPLRLSAGFLPPAAWPAAWATVAGRALREGWPWLAWLAAAASAGAALLAHPSLRPARRGALTRAAALAAAALAYAAFAGALRWVADNQFHWRYLAPAALLLHLAAVSLLAEPLARLPRLAGPALAAALAALPLAALVAWGWPSPAGVRADLDAVAGRHTEEVLAAGCDVVVGDYWSVWPAVWHAALVARERGLAGAPHGLTHRANPTIPAWWGRPRAALRLCRPHGPAAAREAERWLRTYGLWPAEVVARRATIDVLAVAPRPAAP